MAIVCQAECILLAFQNTETLLAWVLTVRRHLGEEHQFAIELIKAPPLSRLFQVAYTLFIQGCKLCLISGIPPKIHASWQLSDIRKFGIYDNKFCFEAGDKCDRYAGLYALLCDQLHEIHKIIQFSSIQIRSRCNSSNSRRSSKTSICSGTGPLADLQTGSLTRNIHRRGNISRHQGTDSNSPPGAGLVRCATVSEADCHRPNRIQDINATQPTSNIGSRIKHVKTDAIENKESGLESRHPNEQHADNDAQCLNYSDLEKSRRYSSGDLCMSKGTPYLPWHKKQQEVFGASATVFKKNQSTNNSCQNQRSQSEVNVSDFYIKFQRTFNVLSPKLGKPGDWKGVTVSSDSVQTGSSSCILDLESHGHGSQNYTSNSSLDLSEILQNCSIVSSEDKLSLSEAVSHTGVYLKSTSSGSSSSTRELLETPTVKCSIGSTVNFPLVQNLPCRQLKYGLQHSCGNSRRRLSNSVANLSWLPTNESPVVSHSLSWTPLNCCPSEASLSTENNSNSMRHSTCYNGNSEQVSAQSGAKNPKTECNHKQVSDNPLSPLKYVDLSRFDGIDDGYIYCLKSPKQFKKNKGMRRVEYQNIPSGSRIFDSNKSLLQNEQIGNACSAKNSDRILVIGNDHHHLPANGNTYVGWEKKESDKIEDKLAGEYVRLRESTPKSLDVVAKHTPPRPNRKLTSGSMENIRRKEHISPACSLKYICDSEKSLPELLENSPGSDLSAIVPTHLAAYSKEDLMEALTKSKNIDNKFIDSLDRKSYETASLPRSKTSTELPRENNMDYIMMGGSLASVNDNSNFCTVELPHRRLNSNCSDDSYLNMSLGNNSRKGSVSPASEEPYLNMSLGRSPDKFSRASPLKHALTEPAYLDMNNSLSGFSSFRASKPKLIHSKSLDDELDAPCTSNHKHRDSTEYLFMSPGAETAATDENETSKNGRRDSAIYVNRSALKPFDNLIPHKPYTEQTLKDNEDNLSIGSSIVTMNNSASDKTSSEEDNTSQKSGKSGKSGKKNSLKSNGKSSNLFSRLMKRHSVKSKEKVNTDKNDKSKSKLFHSTQDFSAVLTETALDRRHSVQPKCTHNAPMITQSSSRLSDLVSRDSESFQTVLNRLSSSIRSESTLQSGLVPLSQWRLGGSGSNIPLSNRTNFSQDVFQSPARLCQPNEYEAGKLPVHEKFETEKPDPPVLPPKTYKKPLIELVLSSTPPSRRHSSEDGNSVERNAYYNRPYANSGSLAKAAVQNFDDDDDIPDDLPPPPPIPDKVNKNGKKSHLGFADIPTMETVHEGSNSVERGSDRGEDSDIDDDVFLSNTPPKTNNRHASVLPPANIGCRPKKNPNLIVSIPGVSSCRGREALQESSQSESRSLHAQPSLGGTTEDRRLTGSVRTASTSSCDSCDTHSTYCDEHHHVSSPAISTMRPRFGKEYKRVDRKKLAEELKMPLPGQSSVPHSTEPSPSSASVFTFDCVPTSGVKSRQGSSCSSHTCGEISPKYPHANSGVRHSRDPAYVNLSFSRNSSPIILDSTPPPHSPGGRSLLSDGSDVLLNYAEIDLSDSVKGKKPVRTVPKKGGVEYAVIDMVATAAVQRVGREHAQLREAKLLRKGRDTSFKNSCSPQSRCGSVTLPNPTREKRTSLGRSNSTSSRDKKP